MGCVFILNICVPVVHCQKILKWQCLNKSRLTTPLHILIGLDVLKILVWLNLSRFHLCLDSTPPPPQLQCPSSPCPASAGELGSCFMSGKALFSSLLLTLLIISY